MMYEGPAPQAPGFFAGASRAKLCVKSQDVLWRGEACKSKEGEWEDNGNFVDMVEARVRNKWK